MNTNREGKKEELGRPSLIYLIPLIFFSFRRKEGREGERTEKELEKEEGGGRRKKG